MKNKPAGGLGSRVVNNSKSARKVEPKAMAITREASRKSVRPWATTPRTVARS